LSPEGDIQNVYNNGGPKGDAAYVLAHAITQGGRTLDCYDDYLPKLYRQFGMKETGRMTFNPDFAPPGWDHVKDDSPDVVFMGWDGYPEGSPERAVARAKGNKDDWIPNERASQREADWDTAKGRSQAYVRGEEVSGVAPEGIRPQAVRAGEAPRPGAGEAGRRPVIEEKAAQLHEQMAADDLLAKGPATPGSKVGYMPPEEEEAPPAKGKKVAAQKIVAPKELRDEFITPQEQAVLDQLKEDSKRVLNKYKEGPTNVAAESLGEKKLPPEVKMVEQVGEHYDARNPTLDFNNPDHRESMAITLVHDILRRIISHPDSYGWYNRNVKAAMQEIGKLNPKIATDPLHNLVMRLCLAVTSQDQKVHPNFESAYRAYLYWNRTGRFPDAIADTTGKYPEHLGGGREFFGGGTKVDAMEGNFAKLNKLWDKHGPDKLEAQLKERMTIRDIDKVFGTNIDEPKDYVTEYSAILGPKIGSFFNNLSGIFHTLTSDVWMTRTFNRLAGKMMAFRPSVLFRNPDPKQTAYLPALRKAIADGTMENATAKQQKTMLREANALDRYKDNPDALDRKTAMELAPTIRNWASEQHGRFAANTPDPTGKKRSYWDKRPINYLAKNIDNNFSTLSGGPRSPAEREAFRDIMQRAINKLAAEGINITPADAQAVVWYMEQDLFSVARYGRPGEGSFDYLDAAYALRNKYQGKTPNQFGEVPEEAPSAPKKKIGKAGKMPEGPPEPVPTERGPPTLAPPVTQAEKEEAERRKQLPVAQAEAQPEPEERQAEAPSGAGGWRPTLPPPSAVAAAATQQPPLQPQSAEPGIDIQSRSYTKGRTVRPQWIVLHSTDATEGSSINTLTQGGKSVHYLSTRDGRLLHFVPEADTAYHAGKDKFGRDGNPGSIGFEQVHNDDLNEPWDDAEVRATARGVAGAMQRWGIPLNHVIGHGDLAPGRKVDPKGYPWDKFYGYVREALGQGGAPPAATTKGVATVSQPDQETRRRIGSASAAHIMRAEGAGGSQDGVREIYGFREGEDSEYPTLARLRASGDEAGVARVASQGFVNRAIDAGSQQFSDPRIKAQIMSLAHMRGPSGARAILNAVGTGRLANSGRAQGLDPEAVRAINQMGTDEFLRRVEIARTKYDQIVHGQDYWARFGRGLESRYARERQFYGSLS
jgi:N-acetyl-anhydromuramyl-L-alanine amidase AmpD